MTTKIRLLHDTVGIPTGAVAVTQSASDNTTKVATTAYVTTALANLADSAPSTLNTLNELAAALGDDANFSTTVTNSIAAKLPLAGGTLTGSVNIGSYQGSAVNSPLDIKSDSNHFAISIEENSGTETWQLGVNADGDLNFYDSGATTPIVTFSDSNNIGIGEVDPDNKLDVNFNITGEGSQEGGIKIHNVKGANNDIAPLYFGVHGGTRRTKAAIGLKREGSYGIGSLIFALDSNGDDANVTFANDEKMRINTRGALVFTPSSGVEVNNSIVAHSNNYMYMFGNTAGLILQNNTAGDTRIRIEDNNSMRFETSSLERMRIDSNGKAIFVKQIEVGTFPVSQTNSGEAWIGRGSDRQDGSLTVQLGGDSASGTSFEIVDRQWTKVPFFVSGEAPGLALGVNAGGIIKIQTAGNVADGSYYSAMTINNVGTNTFSGIRFDRSNVAKWRAGLRNDDKFHISNLFTDGSVASPNDDCFVITNTSRVGINNASPDATLTVGDGQSNYVRIDNAASGDVSSGYQIYSGSTLTTQLYGNASEGWTTLLSGGALNFRVNNASSGFNPMGIDTSGRVTMPYQPAFCVYNPGSTYPTAGGTKAFGKNDATDGNYSTHVNVGSHFSTTTGRFTAPVAGNYYFSFSAMFDNGSGGSAGFDFKINDVAKNGGEGLDNGTTTYVQMAGSILFALSVNDYVTLTIRGRRIHQRYGSFEGFLVG